MKNTGGTFSTTRLLHLLDNWAVGSGPLYRLLAHALAVLIQQGELPVNALLPAERVLAKTLAVSRTTVATAYKSLQQEGWVESRQGSGTRVCRPEHVQEMIMRNDHLVRIVRKGTKSSLLMDEQMERPVDFSLAAPLALPTVTEAFDSLIRDEGKEVITGQGYFVAGHPRLRQTIAAYFTAKGVPTTDEQILVTTGAQQALGLLTTLFLESGDDVIVENPTYPGMLDILRLNGVHIRAVPVDSDGIRVDTLEERIVRNKPRLLIVTPTFHNPTGTILSEARRRAIVRLVSQFDVPLIEDATLADVVLESSPPPSLLCYGSRGQIVSIGSMSKLFWGGLRVGWIRASTQLIARLARLKATADLGTSLLDQLISARLLTHLEEIQTQRRQELLSQREQMTACLQSLLPSWKWQVPTGGLSLWVQLPSGNANEFVQIALRHGVVVVAGPRFSSDESWSDYIRISFASNIPTIRQGIDHLARAWEAYQEKGAITTHYPSPIV